MASKEEQKLYRRVKTPTLLQMEAVECGAAALGILLRYYGKYIPLEELRLACDVSRDGSTARKIVQAAQGYGLEASGLQRSSIRGLMKLQLPIIAFWKFNHFLVIEGYSKNKVYLNDPATGPRTVSWEEFNRSYTGIVLQGHPTEDFQKGGEKFSLIKSLRPRLQGSHDGLLYVLLASFFLLIPGLVIPIFLQVFIDKILIGGKPWLEELLLAMGLTTLLILVLTFLQQTFLLRLETKLSLRSSSQFLWHVFHLPIEFFTQRYGGEIASRVQINNRVAALLSGQLATTIINMLLAVFYAVLMLRYDVPLTIIGISVALLNLALLRYISRQRVDASMGLLQEQGKLTGTVINGLETIETLKSSGGEADFFGRWAGFQAKALNTSHRLQRLTLVLNSIPLVLLSLNSTAILIVGSLRIIEGHLTVGMLMAFQSLMAGFTAPIAQFMSLGGQLQEAEGSLSRLDDVLHYPQDRASISPKTVPQNAGRLEGYLELREVCFGYSRTEAPLIEDFNLQLKPGQRVALVGGSGSGKSTIARLVAGLYEPWSGEVLFDGQSRYDLPRSQVTASVAMVDQNVVLFAGTIRDNLTLWNATIPIEQVIQAAKDAVIHETIAARSGSYEFLVEESGRNFSGGERQRLEIARALTINPRILILDEATSALDPLTEQQIVENLQRRGYTCLIVAHRLSTIRDCDEIIVLQAGKIMERGTHTALLNQAGLYSQLIGADKLVKERKIMDSVYDKLR
jgi:NHLM bacteriocin system ABC transporter peptidase/ATP-binding protein